MPPASRTSTWRVTTSAAGRLDQLCGGGQVVRRGRRRSRCRRPGRRVEGDDVGALGGQPDGVAPALPAGRAGDQRHLAATRPSGRRPCRAVGRCSHGLAPVVAGIRPVGRQPRRSRGPGAGPRARPPGPCGAPRSRRPASVPGTLEVEGLVGQPVAAVDDDGGRHRRGWRPSTGPRGGPDLRRGGAAGPGAPADAGPLQAGVGVGQVTGQRQQRAGDLVGRHQGDRRGPPRPATRPPPRRSGRPPCRGRRPGRRAGRPDPPASAVAASTTVTEPSVGHRRRCGPSPGGEHHGRAVVVGRRRGRRPSPRPRCSTATPSRAHSAASQCGQVGQPLASGADGRRHQRTAESGRPLDHPDPVAPEGEHPGAFEAGRPGPHDQGVDRGARPGRGGAASGSTSTVSWPDRGSPTQLTSGLRLSRTRQAWLHRMHGRTVGATAVADLGHQAGVGDLGPGHLDQVGGAVGQRAIRPWSGRPRSPAAPRGPGRRRPARIAAHSSRLTPAGVWASGR